MNVTENDLQYLRVVRQYRIACSTTICRELYGNQRVPNMTGIRKLERMELLTASLQFDCRATNPRRTLHFALTDAAEQLLAAESPPIACNVHETDFTVCNVRETDFQVLLIIAALARTKCAPKEEILLLLNEIQPNIIPFRLITMLKTLAQQQLVMSRFTDGVTHYSLTPMGKAVIDIGLRGASSVNTTGLV